MSKSKTKKDRRAVKATMQTAAVEAAAIDKPKAAKPTAKALTANDAPETRDYSKLGFAYGTKLVRSALTLFKDNFESCLIMFVLPSLLLILGSLLVGDGSRVSSMTLVGALLALAGFIWYLVSMFASGPFSLAIARGEQPGVIRYYRLGMHFAPRLLGLTLIIVPLFAAGLCLFIVPGLIVLRRYGLAYYCLVDYNLGIRDAMDMSATMTKPEPKAVFGIAAVLLLFILVANAFGRTIMPYGNIIAIIIDVAYILAPALLYVELQKRLPDENIELTDEQTAGSLAIKD